MAVATPPAPRGLRVAPPARLPERPSRAAGIAERAGDWPRTGRVLPWTLAGFIAMLWLTPFHAIELSASLPFDVSLDRLVLPWVVGLWVLVMVAGGRHAPRLRLTPVHVGVGTFVAVAFASVAVNVGGLNETLLLGDAIKRLMLLASYAALFVVLASTVRPTEVRAFLLLILGLAVLTALGTIYEYRFQLNVFYDWSRALLPGTFQVPVLDPKFVDENGRRAVVGPAEVGLETVAMLAMAVPIALVGMLQAQRRGHRWLFGLAVCLLFAAALSTYRKSALIAPSAAVATVLWYRRGDLVRLIPFAIVLVAVVHVAAPGAIGSVTDQLRGNRLQTNTTLHRLAGYDAVRPLVWSNVALGQGYGSYDAYANHILDSQVLTSAIETGVLGLLAYIGMCLSVVVAARPSIRGPDPGRVLPALAAAAAAVTLLTVSFLYDAMIFPHVPYIFLTLAALMAVAWRAPGEDTTPGERPVPGATAP